MDINTLKSVYFIGAGGIGMSALVRYFLSKGKKVGGYDRTPSELTAKLMEEGAQIHYEDTVESIPADFRNADSTLIVYTAAMPEDHVLLQHFRQHGFTIYKRAQVLGMLTRTGKGLCVAGTHGKTTTSTMTAHLLHQSHVECDAFLGGISKNYGTNLLLSDSSDYVVIEADEFDRSFHWLSPYATVITSTDADHLDIYGTEEAYQESFNHYTSLIQPGGALVMRHGIRLAPRLQKDIRLYTYSTEAGDFHAENIRIGGGEIVFDYVSPLGNIQDIQLGVPVAINIENGIAAMALAQLSGVTADEIKAAMASFQGIERRFDFKIKTDKMVYLSDYAHHPEEIKQSILSMRALYGNKKLTAVFQPHLYTRTRDFYQEFADSLSLLDEVILTDIYPARELPIEGVSSQLIFDHLRSDMEKTLCRKEEVLELLKEKDIEVLITLGAGDIENYASQICEILNRSC
ncbi:MAG: UDP-N-acetylmuramate--L-alanine ligase [Bacteroidaceae bacterium]|nr:UDP-N-acetylmuramate--L-alanine ligase [Bacteroidaceae bacterium]